MEKKLPINGLQKGIFLDEKQDIWFYLENILIFVERERAKSILGQWKYFSFVKKWRCGREMSDFWDEQQHLKEK